MIYLECMCNANGSISLDCDDNGQCLCKDGFTGTKCFDCKPYIIGQACDSCEPFYFNYPNCEGLCTTLEGNIFIDYLWSFQTANVILLDQFLWNAMTMEDAHAIMDLLEKNVIK